MSSPLNVVLLGGSGNVGSIILNAILEDPSLNVSALTRASSQATLLKGAKIVRTDFSESSLIEAFTGQDVVISVVGATALADQKRYIDAAVKAGVKRFLPSEFGIDSLSKPAQDLLPLLATKTEVLGYLKTKEADGLTWTALMTGLLFDWCLQAGFLGFDLSAKKATIWDQGTRRFSVTNEADLGKAVLGILRNPVETANKVLYVQTLSTTQQEILEGFTTQTGSWTTELVNTKDMLVSAQNELAQGKYEGAYTLVKALAYGNVPGAKANFEEDGELANALLNIPTGSVAETVKRVLQ